MHRYTRWTGRLSQQSSNLSCPLFTTKGLWSVFHSIPGSRGEGSDQPSYHQTTEVTLTKGSPERSGYMHIDKQVTLSILVMLFSSRGTETAKVEGLWLINRPECLAPAYPDDSPKIQMCSPFIVPSLNSMKDPHDVTLWHHDCLLWSSSGKTTTYAHWNCHGSSVHPPASMLKPQRLQKLWTSLSLPWPNFHACDTLPQVFWCTLIQESNLFTFSKRQAIIINKLRWWI